MQNVLPVHDPSTYEQAKGDPRWEDAMTIELATLETNEIWEVIDLPPRKKAINSKWYYTVKYKPNGTIDKYKAMFLVQGFTQVKDKECTHTFSHVAKLPIVRMLIAVTTIQKWSLYQLDVNNSFLHGYLDEEAYILPPKGYSIPPGKACKLQRSLYGLAQASR